MCRIQLPGGALSLHLPCNRRPPLEASLPSPEPGLPAHCDSPFHVGLWGHQHPSHGQSPEVTLGSGSGCGVGDSRLSNGLLLLPFLPRASPCPGPTERRSRWSSRKTGWGGGECTLLAPRAGPRTVLAVYAVLCEEGNARRCRVHERKAPPDSETLGVWGQDADGRAGREPGPHPEGRGGAGSIRGRRG